MHSPPKEPSPSAQGPGDARPGSPGRRLFDFASRRAAGEWYSIDDRVMGGVSRSSITHEPDSGAVFEGELSLDHGGGFASVRCLPAAFDLARAEGVELCVRGDGKTYQLRMRTQGTFEGPNYRASFVAPAGDWIRVRLPFGAFEPTLRGRVLEEVEPLEPRYVRTFGLMIEDRQEGPFRLQVAWIDTY